MKRSFLIFCALIIIALGTVKTISYCHSKDGVIVRELAFSELTKSEQEVALFDDDYFVLVKATDGKYYHAINVKGHQKNPGDKTNISNLMGTGSYVVG